MRKWYGQSDGEGGDGYDDYDIDYDDEEEEEQGEDERPTVLVMDADSEVGTLVVLQLILQRRRVRIVCKDASAVKAAYGDYVQPVEADCNDAASLGAALRGAKMVICSGQVGALTKAIRGDSLNKPVRVDAVVLLSATGITTGKEEAGGGLLGMFSADAAERKTLRSPQREQQVAAAGVPYIVVRVPPFKDVAGSQRVVVAQGDTLSGGSISREQAARLLIVAALTLQPASGVLLEAAAAPGEAEEVAELEAALRALQEK